MTHETGSSGGIAAVVEFRFCIRAGDLREQSREQGGQAARRRRESKLLEEVQAR